MKKNLKIIAILLTVFSLTGCTTYLKQENNGKTEIVKNEITGQNLTKNILCKPEDKDVIKIYEKYNKNVSKSDQVNLEKLPSCNKLTPASGSYEGIWTTVFVKPIAWLIIQLGEILKSYGFALIVATLLIRGVLYPLTKKTAMQSENMKKAQKDLEKLEKKYQNRNDQESMMQKSQEMMIIYKKYNINPLSGCLFSFIQIPLFFAFLEAINRIPVIFEENFLGLFQLGTSPAVAVFTNHQYYYAILIIIIVATTYFSLKLNSSAMNKEQENQMKMMTNMMVIFMTITTFSISTGIAIYWTVSNLFTIVQNLVVKRGKKNVKSN